MSKQLTTEFDFIGFYSGTLHIVIEDKALNESMHAWDLNLEIAFKQLKQKMLKSIAEYKDE